MTTAISAAQPYADRPLETDLESYRRIVGAFEMRARATLKSAKERYRSGLPPRYRFYVSTRLTNPGVAVEEVFVSATGADDTSVSGVIDSEPTGKVPFKRRDPIHVLDENITNWTILSPDGKEEGNFVGKAIDATAQGATGPIFLMTTSTPDMARYHTQKLAFRSFRNPTEPMRILPPDGIGR